MFKKTVDRVMEKCIQKCIKFIRISKNSLIIMAAHKMSSGISRRDGKERWPEFDRKLTTDSRFDWVLFKKCDGAISMIKSASMKRIQGFSGSRVRVRY